MTTRRRKPIPPFLPLLALLLLPPAAAALPDAEHAPTPPRIGTMEFIALPPLRFAHDADLIDERIGAQLEDAALFIRHNPRITRVLIRGHADILAGANYNQDLSQRRAEAVRIRLLELGVAAHLLHLGAYGKSAPVDENWTQEGRNRNRRVEIYVLSHTR